MAGMQARCLGKVLLPANNRLLQIAPTLALALESSVMDCSCKFVMEVADCLAAHGACA